MTELEQMWRWIDSAPWIVDALAIWVVVAFVLGKWVGWILNYLEPTEEERER